MSLFPSKCLRPPSYLGRTPSIKTYGRNAYYCESTYLKTCEVVSHFKWTNKFTGTDLTHRHLKTLIQGWIGS